MRELLTTCLTSIPRLMTRWTPWPLPDLESAGHRVPSPASCRRYLRRQPNESDA